MGTRRQFSREFKLEAVKLVKERGVSVVQALPRFPISALRSTLRVRGFAPAAGLKSVMRPKMDAQPYASTETDRRIHAVSEAILWGMLRWRAEVR